MPDDSGAAEGPDLAALLEAVADGDRAAFQSLYQASAPKLFGVILRITGNRAVAEEVLQNAFLKVWQNADRYSPAAGRPITWLCALGRHAAIDQIRSDRTSRQSSVELDEAALRTLAAPARGDGSDGEALRVCLQQLEAEARDCVVLAYCWGSSREELAKRFGRPVNTIKTLLHRNLKALASCLEAP